MMSAPSHRLRWGLVVVALSLAIGRAEAQSAPPVLENAALRLAFSENGALVAFHDKARDHAHIDADAAPELWTALLADGGRLSPADAGQFSWEGPEGPSPTLTLTWSEFNRATAPDLKVVARVSLDPDDAVSRWRIRVEGLNDLPLQSVRFPRLGGLAPQERETLAVPVWMGERTDQARRLLSPTGRREWEYPGILSMQCLAFYGDDGPGLMLSTNDTAAQRKLYAAFGLGDNAVGLETTHVRPAGSVEDVYEPPYDTLLTAFAGDWFTAAERYRAWAMDQHWVRDSRMKRGLTPDWLRDTGIWVWNRGRSPGVLGPAAVLRDHADLPVSVFWHWWHGCAYDTGFPEYLPPREGAEAFREAVADARTRGIHALVYMNQRLWGMTAESWESRGAARYAVKGPDGTIRPEVYNTFNKAPCASMCMGTSFWRDTYAGLAEEAVRDLGVAGIYMDQACSSLACYDPSHGHPLGGGAYWIQGFQALSGDIRARCADVRPVVLSGEGCGEAWLPYLDAMLSLQVSMERYAAPGEWEPIPFFHAVYHDCGVYYGNYSSLTRPPYDDLWPAEFAPEHPLAPLDRKFSTQFRLEQARAFVWGQQPTVANFLPEHLTERAEEMDYVLRLARVRRDAAKYLQDGVFLRPPAIDAPQREIPISRLSIYAGQHDAVQEYAKVVPMALASAWRAADGSVALVLAGISTEPLPLRLLLERDEYPLPDSGVISRITEDGTEKIGEFGEGPVALDVDLEPSGACVYTFTAN